MAWRRDREKKKSTRAALLATLLPPLNLKEIVRLLTVFGLGGIVISVLMFKTEDMSADQRDWGAADAPAKADNPAIARSLFADHAATFLVIAILLLVAIIGGVLLAKEVD
ncbi:MAG TPA: NADH-quinone oxidoreductase subunit J [Thermoplasmata archaeon]|nr:NADH-quinone oxidoreductase subunit J [Thermoplasmata archaeon]